MKTETMMMTVEGGVVTLARPAAQEVLFRFTANALSLELILTPEEAGSLGGALSRYASEECHPDACCACGSVTPTPGCQCDDTPVTWWVMSRLNYGDGQDRAKFVLACEDEDSAEKEAWRMQQNHNAKEQFSLLLYFAYPMRVPKGPKHG